MYVYMYLYTYKYLHLLIIILVIYCVVVQKFIHYLCTLHFSMEYHTEIINILYCITRFYNLTYEKFTMKSQIENPITYSMKILNILFRLQFSDALTFFLFTKEILVKIELPPKCNILLFNKYTKIFIRIGKNSI